MCKSDSTSSTMPTAEDLTRFVLEYPSRRVAAHTTNRTAFSWEWMRSGIKQIIILIKEDFPDFVLDRKQSHALKAAIRSLQREGTLTKQPLHDKEWITCKLVLTMVTALVRDAVMHRTHDWSFTISRALFILLQTSLTARVGDMSVSRNTSSEYCFKYKHVIVRVVEPADGSDAEPTFDAQITLAHSKGGKDDPSANGILTLESLDEPRHQMIDAIKLLLIMAMRTGAAKSTAIGDARRRKDGIVQWVHRDRPVLNSFDKMKLHVEVPAGVSQVLRSLNMAAKVSGVTQRLTRTICVEVSLERSASWPQQSRRPVPEISLAIQTGRYSKTSPECTLDRSEKPR